jgi:hypothetical protein
LNSSIQSDGQSRPFLDLHYHGEITLIHLETKGQSPQSELVSFKLKFKGQEEWVRSTLPVIFEISPDHELKKIRAPEPASREEREELNVFRDFASLFAFASNRDPSGAYAAEWKNEGPLRIKNKTRYLGKSESNLQVVSSRHEIRLEKGHLQSAIGKESLKISMNSSSHLVTHSDYVIRFKVRGGSEKISTQAQVLAQLKETELRLDQGAAPEKKISWAEVEGRLLAISSLDESGRLELFHDLIDVIRKDPSKLKTLVDQVEASGFDSLKVHLAVGVLASLESEEAQKTLIDWYRGPGATRPALEHLILNAFATTDAKLGEPVLQFLLALPDTNENAAFALGSSLRNQSSQAVRDRLQAQFEQAKTDLAQMNALDAIGNSGDQKFESDLMKSLQTGSTQVREKAVFAARLMPPAQALSVMMAGYRDPEERVRFAAVQALQYRNDLDWFQPLLQECVKDRREICLKRAQSHL